MDYDKLEKDVTNIVIGLLQHYVNDDEPEIELSDKVKPMVDEGWEDRSLAWEITGRMRDLGYDSPDFPVIRFEQYDVGEVIEEVFNHYCW